VAELKTRRTRASPGAFIRSIPDPERRRDAGVVSRLMARVTGERPAMWGSSIVGFGSYHYRSGSGREGDWPLTAFSPRARNLTLYVMSGFKGHDALLAHLGKHSTGKSCLYLKRLADVDLAFLEELVRRGVEATRRHDRSGSEPARKAARKR